MFLFSVDVIRSQMAHADEVKEEVDWVKQACLEGLFGRSICRVKFCRFALHYMFISYYVFTQHEYIGNNNYIVYCMLFSDLSLCF